MQKANLLYRLFASWARRDVCIDAAEAAAPGASDSAGRDGGCGVGTPPAQVNPGCSAQAGSSRAPPTGTPSGASVASSPLIGGCPFAFRHVKPFGHKLKLDEPGPCVLFATPGMLFAGFALEAFRRWAGDERNMVLLPSYW